MNRRKRHVDASVCLKRTFLGLLLDLLLDLVHLLAVSFHQLK